MPNIAVIGSIVADIVVQTPHIPSSGENLHVPRIQVMTGGKAANAAVAFARLGGTAHLIGNTGVDAFSDMARAALSAERVDIAGVHSDPHAATGAGILLNEENGHTAFMIAPGANQTLKPAQLEASLRPLLPDLDGLLFNFESPEDCLLLAVELAQTHHVPFFVDAGPGQPYSPDLWRHATILTPNQPEAEAIVGHRIGDDRSAIAAAQTMLSQGPAIVVLKLGARGALLATENATTFIPAFPIQAVDNAGAGDAFTAGLVLAVLNETPLSEAVRFANGCGAIAASRFGTMPAMPYGNEVTDLLQRSGKLA